MTVKIPVLHCGRCGNSWTPRGDREFNEKTAGMNEEEIKNLKYIAIDVTMCPACKSPLWNKPKKTKKEAS